VSFGGGLIGIAVYPFVVGVYARRVADRTGTTSEPCEPRFPLGAGKDSETVIAITFV
jgi:hypothetical protein